jgi:DNA-binding NtrC family response regulator
MKSLGGEKIDLLISDYQMPGTDGKGLFRRVKRIHPSLPVI